jgi:hypothetical protein
MEGVQCVPAFVGTKEPADSAVQVSAVTVKFTDVRGTEPVTGFGGNAVPLFGLLNVARPHELGGEIDGCAQVAAVYRDPIAGRGPVSVAGLVVVTTEAKRAGPYP